MPKQIFILDGHPAKASLSRTLAETYAQAAEAAGHDLRMTHLSDLSFDMDFEKGGYSDYKPLEPDLEGILDNLAWADHFVLTTPMWWGGLPARLKGLIDRTFLPGRAFDTRGRQDKMPLPMLNLTGRVIFTSDTPGWFLNLIYGKPFIRQTKKQILGFVGIRPSRFTHFTQASHATGETVANWSAKVRALGTSGA